MEAFILLCEGNYILGKCSRPPICHFGGALALVVWALCLRNISLLVLVSITYRGVAVSYESHHYLIGRR